jgi:hypothetical protein
VLKCRGVDSHPPSDFVNFLSITQSYYLADDIYPECGAFIKTISLPKIDKQKLFDKF